jgi:YidC/Oxa1 family membrane protein insertase
VSIFSPAYDVVLAASQALTPLFGAAATAATIVLATLAVRLLLLPLTFRQVRIERCRAELAPRVEKLRKLHHDDPLKALTETNALYRAEGVGTATTLLPLLAQSPFFLVLYSLFRKPSIDGHANALLQHSLLDVPLGSHWHSLVFAGVLALLAIVAAVSMRRLRRLGQSWLLAVTPVRDGPVRVHGSAGGGALSAYDDVLDRIGERPGARSPRTVCQHH